MKSLIFFTVLIVSFISSTYTAQQSLSGAKEAQSTQEKSEKTFTKFSEHRILVAIHEKNFDFLDKINSQKYKNHLEMTPLMMAINADANASVITFLLDHKSTSVSDTDLAGWNALMYAVNENQAETVRTILSKINPHYSSESFSAGVSNLSSEKLNKRNLKRSKIVNQASCTKKTTPLLLASQNALSEIVDMLIEAEANVNELNESQETPLMLVLDHPARASSVQAAKALVGARGINKDSVSSNGVNALMLAAYKGYDEALIKSLISPAAINAQDKDHKRTAAMLTLIALNTYSPLREEHKPIIENYNRILAQLINYREADLSLQDAEGETLLDFAVKYQNEGLLITLAQKDKFFHRIKITDHTRALAAKTPFRFRHIFETAFAKNN